MIFNCGDYVTVSNWKGCYPYYVDMAQYMGLRNWVYRGDSPENCLVFKVVAKKRDARNSNKILYGIESTISNKSYIFAGDYLVAIKYNCDLKIGDMVKVTSWGKEYDSFDEMVEFFNLKEFWKRSNHDVIDVYAKEKRETLFKVVGLAPHLKTPKDMVVAIAREDGSRVYLFCPEGLELVIDAHKPTHTSTFVLKFPNGDVVETTPPSTGWKKHEYIDYTWPARHIASADDLQELIDVVVHWEGDCWWGDYRQRSLAEKAQVLSEQVYVRAEPEVRNVVESYTTSPYEWL